MAYLAKENFNRWTINGNNGRSNNCFPSIIATLTGMDTSVAEAKCEGYPARTGRKFGGTKIRWNNVAQQITDSFGIAATDIVDLSANTNYSLVKHGSLAKVVRGIKEDGVYVVIRRGHALGLIVHNNVAHTVDYGQGSHSRCVVWTCTRLDSVNPLEVLRKFKPDAAPTRKLAAPKPKRQAQTVAPIVVGKVKEIFFVNGERFTKRKLAAAAAGCSVGRIAELVRDARANDGSLTKIVKGSQIRVMLNA